MFWPLHCFSPHVLNHHVRYQCQSPSSPRPLEMKRQIGQTVWGVDSQPGRRGRGRRRRRWVLAAAESSRQPWHRLLQYATSPAQTEGKLWQLWSLLTRQPSCCVQPPQLTDLNEQEMLLAAVILTQTLSQLPALKTLTSLQKALVFFDVATGYWLRLLLSLKSRVDFNLPAGAKPSELCLTRSPPAAEHAPPSCSSLSRKDKEKQLRVMNEVNYP